MNIIFLVFGCGSVSSSDSSESKGETVADLKSVVTNATSKHHHHHHKRKNKIKAIDPNSYHAKRDRLKKKIVEEVLAKALPDRGAFDVQSIITGPKKRWRGCLVDFMKVQLIIFVYL
jgi:hypothetical protein